MKNVTIAACLILAFSGCSDVSYSDNQADWYAVVEKPLSGDLYVALMVTEWTPLINPSGIGGPREHRLYVIDIHGPGPVYRAHEKLNQSSIYPDYGGDYEGTVTIDLKKNKVFVDMKRFADRRDESKQAIAYPNNGSFKLNRGLENLPTPRTEPNQTTTANDLHAD